MLLPTRILVPTDFSQASQGALALALTLARAGGGSVTLLHSRATGEPEATARRALLDVADRHQGSGVRLFCVLRSGEPEEEILTAAEEQDADLIVMATQHGKRSGDGLGSVAESVVRSARRPTLVVPRD